MYYKYDLPNNMITVIENENIDFSVKAKRGKPIRSSISTIIFGLGWTAFTSIFVYAFFGPIFFGEEVHFTSNGTPTVASPENLEPLIFPGIIIGLFVLIGVGMLTFGLFSIFKKGGYFVGTKTRLITYQKNIVRSIDWEQFSGDIEVFGNEINGNISLKMRTGKMVSRKNNRNIFIPEIIYITGIPNVFEIEQICRKRIKENDPTLPITISSNQN